MKLWRRDDDEQKSGEFIVLLSQNYKLLAFSIETMLAGEKPGCLPACLPPIINLSVCVYRIRNSKIWKSNMKNFSKWLTYSIVFHLQIINIITNEKREHRPRDVCNLWTWTSFNYQCTFNIQRIDVIFERDWWNFGYRICARERERKSMYTVGLKRFHWIRWWTDCIWVNQQNLSKYLSLYEYTHTYILSTWWHRNLSCENQTKKEVNVVAFNSDIEHMEFDWSV